MLYTAQFYCPCHTETLRIYDDKTWKPCIGLCGHTVCLECIEKNLNMACPICNQPDVFVHKTPNYAAIELIRDCRDNFSQLMKNWWSGENIDSPCSRCSEQTRALRICLTCDEGKLCTIFLSERRLEMHNESDLLNLSRHVVCSDCAINHHKGHQTINIERIKHSKEDIKTATSRIILELFRQVVDDSYYTVKCRLRQKRIQIIGRFIEIKLRDLDHKEEGECGYLGDLIRIELITKYIKDIDQKWKDLVSFSVGTTQCECNILFRKLMKTRTAVDYDYEEFFDAMCHSGIGMFSPGCPLFLKSHLEKRLKLNETIKETPPEQVTPEPFNDRQCPLCVIVDHGEHKQKHHRQNWLEIVENIRENDMPPLSDFCCRCLDHLNSYQVGGSCERNVGNHKGEDFRYHNNQRGCKYLGRHVRNSCQKPNCLMKDPKFWKYDMIRENHKYLACIMRNGCIHQNFSCQLKTIRLESSAREAYRALCKQLNSRKNSKEEFDNTLKNVEDAFELLKNRKAFYGAEIQEPKCKCSKLWSKNQILLKKLDEESSATRKPYLEFKLSMEKMAEYLLKEETPGCPMEFDHGIVLDPIVLEELEDMDLDDSLEIKDLEVSLKTIGVEDLLKSMGLDSDSDCAINIGFFSSWN